MDKLIEDIPQFLYIHILNLARKEEIKKEIESKQYVLAMICHFR
jgi:hypothetical protein